MTDCIVFLYVIVYIYIQSVTNSSNEVGKLDVFENAVLEY